MTRRPEAGKLSIPIVAAGIAVVGAGVAGARYFGGETPSSDPQPQFANMGKFPSLKAISINRQHVGLSSSQRGAIRLPEFEFELYAPKDKAASLEAWIEGGKGERLALTSFREQGESRFFGRLGIDHEIDSARLIVQSAGKTVIEQNLEDIPKPMRAIPLVVPIDEKVRLRALPESQCADLRAKYPGETFYAIEGAKPGAIANHILRTEWAANAEFAFQLPGTKRPPVFGMPTSEPTRLAELDQPDFYFESSVNEADMIVEIVDVGGVPTLRVKEAVNVTFKDGAKVEILPQERKATGGPGDRNFGISSRELMGNTLSIVPRSKPFSIDPMPPKQREHTRIKKFDDLWNTKVELVSPSLASIGLNRLRIGPHELKATESASVPLAYGEHKIRLRFSRKGVMAIDRRRIVEVIR